MLPMKILSAVFPFYSSYIWLIGIKKNLEGSRCCFKRDFLKNLLAQTTFREICSKEQDIGESVDNFVCRIRALLSQLPYTLPVEAQIDIVFGLLNIERYYHVFFNYNLVLYRIIEITNLSHTTHFGSIV